MAVQFSFRATDLSGELQSGEIEAESVDAAADRIRRMGLRPITIRRNRAVSLQQEIRIPGLGGGRRAEALALMSRQFATMVDAGTPIIRCLDVLMRQAEDKSLVNALGGVKADLENGDPLSVAMTRQPHWFDQFYVAMIRSGEGAGQLPTVLQRLAEATERSAGIRRKVRGALAYPVAVFSMVVLVLLAMMIFLIPTFEGIYADLGGDLPLPTRMVLAVSGFLTGQLPFVIVGCVVIGVMLRRASKKPAGRRRLHAFKLRIPVFGKLVSRTSLARFSRSLSVLVASGVPATDAFAIARSTCGNQVMEEAIDVVVRKIAGGTAIADAMEQHEIFAPMVVQMVRVGEESGALEEMLSRVADVYDAQVDSTVESLTSLVEPVLIVFMGLTVGGVLLAVYLPMFKAIDLVN